LKTFSNARNPEIYVAVLGGIGGLKTSEDGNTQGKTALQYAKEFKREPIIQWFARGCEEVLHLCVCVYVCVCVYMIYMYICIYICTYVYVYIYIHVHIYTFVCIQIYTHTSLCVCVVCECVNVYVCIIYTNI